MFAPASLLAPLVIALNDLDPSPEPEDVKAGYPALFLFLGLLAVIGLLGWSLSRHLRRADNNRKAGLFGDAPEAPATSVDPGTPGTPVSPVSPSSSTEGGVTDGGPARGSSGSTDSA